MFYDSIGKYRNKTNKKIYKLIDFYKKKLKIDANSSLQLS